MIKLYYVEKGEGEPLILLHGNGESNEIFSKQIEGFEKHYKVIAPDTRGHGKTPRGEKPFTLNQFADDLYDFMLEHKIEKAHILGFSDGGNIALLFALKHPEKINKLILNSANYNPNGLKEFFNFTLKIRYLLLKLGKSSEKKNQKNEFLSLMINEPDISEEELKSINVPTLVIAGKKDLIKKKHTEKIAELIPDSKLVFINGNHAAARINPKEFNREVLAFLK